MLVRRADQKARDPVEKNKPAIDSAH
jgi:hypothetical protein